ncbi:MAG: hypothetical protein KDA79_15245 [Planctomycetaceae bacterium]|nr:hypothetical protein [Planctomycetaceae bacterium]
MPFWFPLAHAANSFAVTGLMIAAAVTGRSELAAEIGLIHGALLITFQALSGDARCLALRQDSRLTIDVLLTCRVVLLLPLGVAAWMLSAGTAGSGLLAALLVVRRGAEWLSELHLASRETAADYRSAMQYTALQTVLLGLVVVTGNRFDTPVGAAALCVWSCSPVLLCLRPLFETLAFRMRVDLSLLRSFVPYLGSTTVNAVGVFLFRWLIVGLAGKSTAGELFTAFSLGGIATTLFATAIGPSLVFQANHISRAKARLIYAVLTTYLAAGVLMLLLPDLTASLPDGLTVSRTVWTTTGLSVIGAVLMLVGLRSRFALLQHGGGSVFSRDVLYTASIVLAVPGLYYSLGVSALSFCFLANGLLFLMIYSCGVPEFRLKAVMATVAAWLQQHAPALTVVLLTTPVFFQLAGGLYNGSVRPEAGHLKTLPIPLSVAACYAGLLIMWNSVSFRGSRRVVLTAAGALMGVCLLQVMTGDGMERSRLVLAVQYLLPMPALVLGGIYGRRHSDSALVERVVFRVLAVLVPLQLLATVLSRSITLSPSTGFFSVYQHLQYVPAVFSSLYCFVLFRLFDHPGYRRGLFLLGPVMGIYAALSGSMLSMGFLVCAAGSFTAVRVWNNGHSRQVHALFGLTVGMLAVSMLTAKHLETNYMFQKTLEFTGDGIVLPMNLTERIRIWHYYFNGITESVTTAVFGHSTPPPRGQYPSGHNVVLDLMYNFGLIGLLPFAVLAGGTALLVLRNFSNVLRSDVLSSSVVSLVLLVGVDSLFKVGLRQPWPGLIMYFLWGVTVSRLHCFTEAASLRERQIVVRLPPRRPEGIRVASSIRATAAATLSRLTVAEECPSGLQYIRNREDWLGVPEDDFAEEASIPADETR